MGPSRTHLPIDLWQGFSTFFAFTLQARPTGQSPMWADHSQSTQKHVFGELLGLNELPAQVGGQNLNHYVKIMHLETRLKLGGYK